MIDLTKLGKPETAVAAFVTLLADLCALDEDKMACYLDCYYQLRCTAKKAAALEPVVPDVFKRALTLDDIEGVNLPPKVKDALRAQIIESKREPRAAQAENVPTPVEYHQVMDPETSKTIVAAPFPPLDEVYKGLAPSRPAHVPDPDTDRAPEPPKGFVPVKKNPLRGGASAKFKCETRERLVELRDGKHYSLQAVADASDGTLTLSDLLSILECQKVDLSLYIALAQTLDELTK